MNLTPEQAQKIYTAYVECLDNFQHGSGAHDALRIVLLKNDVPLSLSDSLRVAEYTEEILKVYWRLHPDEAPGDIPKAPRMIEPHLLWPRYE